MTRSTRSRSQRSRQKGAALLMVLLIVAVMSTVAVAITDDLRFAIRRTTNIRDAQQATWYAVGAEQATGVFIEGLLRVDPRLLSLTQDTAPEGVPLPVSRGRLAFPIPSGFINVVVQDGANCFNVNALMSGSQPNGVNPFAVEVFALLLIDLGVPVQRARALVNATTDWIDADGAPRRGGAEDFNYAQLDPPYRAANRPIVDLSELRAITGFDEEVYAGMRRFLCARPSSEMSILNLNTLRDDQAVLLHAVMLGTITVDDARSVIAERGPEGFGTIDEVLEVPVLKRVLSDDEPIESDDEDTVEENASSDDEIDEEKRFMRDQLGLATTRFDVLIQVSYRQAYLELRSAMRVDTRNGAAIESRRFGAL